MAKYLTVGPDHNLTAEMVELVAREPEIKIIISPKARRQIAKSRGVVERLVKNRRVAYGITTGFGNFKDKLINTKDAAELQRNLIRSHAAGVGEPLTQEQVRATLLVRLNSLIQGYSGVRQELIDSITNLLNKKVIPHVPSQGSVGSSGDLAPLSHIALVLMGEGQAWYQNRLMAGHQALKLAGLKPVKLAAKEGLAFNNGTAVMVGIAALVVARTKRLNTTADLACALTLEAVRGVTDAFRPEVHRLRPHPGQRAAAANIMKFTSGSKLINSVKDRIQDAYSLRCAPQVHGAVRDTLDHVELVTERELNAVTDNPLIFTNPDRVMSAGNFHGEPIAIAMDSLGIALAELANISERRTAKLLDPATSEGLPAFLIAPEKAGLHSGLMLVQYTAAALVSENKVLAHPASVDSIPTSANQEDHVSMGTIAARKAIQILENTENVLAIELLTACQAADFRGPHRLSQINKIVYDLVRKKVPPLLVDRQLSKDVAEIKNLISTSAIDKILT
ncbi:MAG: histidine ammonia-lyase [Candidatus Vogelbacteria bacterium]|nr:histidine ammonia-lyase [Candidatus Vogelbacteria bacterium]